MCFDNDEEEGEEKLDKDVKAIEARMSQVNLNHQSMINKLPLSVKMKATKEDRALVNYQKNLEEWEKNAHYFANKFSRNEESLLISSSKQFRESKIEADDFHLKAKTSLPERLGESYWQLSLRSPLDTQDRLALTQKLNKNSELFVTRVDRNYGVVPVD